MNLEDSLHLVLQSPDCQVCAKFYDELFARRPETKRFFEKSNLRHQAAILAMSMQAVVSYAKQDFTAIGDYLKILGHKHRERGIPPEEYPAFRDALLVALAEFHGADWTPDLAEQWHRAIDRANTAMLAGYVDGPLFY